MQLREKRVSVHAGYYMEEWDLRVATSRMCYLCGDPYQVRACPGCPFCFRMLPFCHVADFYSARSCLLISLPASFRSSRQLVRLSHPYPILISSDLATCGVDSELC